MEYERDNEKTPAEIEAVSLENERLEAVEEFRKHVDEKYYAMSTEKIRNAEMWMDNNKISITPGNKER